MHEDYPEAVSPENEDLEKLSNDFRYGKLDGIPSEVSNGAPTPEDWARAIQGQGPVPEVPASRTVSTGTYKDADLF